MRFLNSVTLAITVLVGASGCDSSTDEDEGDGEEIIAPPSSFTKTGTVFAVIGDYGDDDDNTRRVVALMKSWTPDFIITTGDNDYSDGRYRGTFRGLELGVGQYFHDFIGNYQGTSGPGSAVNRFFPTPGDHDWGDTCTDPRGLDDYLRYFTLPSASSGNERYYEFRQGPVHFFSLHSVPGCEPDGVTATSRQAAWVQTTLNASTAPFRIGYFHHPPHSSGLHVGEGAHMRWPWQAWRFDVILSGNDHIYERLSVDGVTYLVVGLGGVDRHGMSATVPGSQVRFNADYGALRGEVFDDRVRLHFVTVTGVVVDSIVVRRR